MSKKPLLEIRMMLSCSGKCMAGKDVGFMKHDSD